MREQSVGIGDTCGVAIAEIPEYSIESIIKWNQVLNVVGYIALVCEFYFLLTIDRIRQNKRKLRVRKTITSLACQIKRAALTCASDRGEGAPVVASGINSKCVDGRLCHCWIRVVVPSVGKALRRTESVVGRVSAQVGGDGFVRTV